MTPSNPADAIAVNPATGARLGTVAATPVDQFAAIFEQARDAQSHWRAKSYAQRRHHINLMRDYIRDHADELARVISEGNGKTRIDALVTEVLPCVLACNWYGNNAAKVLKTQRREASSLAWMGKRSELRHEPLGVVGIISPWNYPLSIPFGEIIMALMAGNGVILKVAENTPLVGVAIEKILAAGNLPDGLFAHIVGEGPTVSTAMFEHGIDKLFFTGSVAVGKLLMAQAAKTLTPVSLELGGKDAMVVLADADLERAANGAAWAGLQNAGQSCGAVERIYVDARVYDEFIALLSEKVRNLRHGIPTDQCDVDMGSMTTAKQRLFVEKQIAQALEAGATVVAESQAAGDVSGEFLAAKVMVNVTHDMDVMRDETFGPVLPVMSFADESEAVRLANDCNLALTASIWSRNTAHAKRLADQLEAGVVAINDHLYTHGMSDLPWGGPKESGIGRTHGPEGLMEMTQPKAVNWDYMRARRNLWWYPQDRATYNAVHQSLQMVAPQSIFAFLKACLQVLPFMLGKMYKRNA